MAGLAQDRLRDETPAGHKKWNIFRRLTHKMKLVTA